MGFQQVVPAAVRPSENGAGQQHAHRLSADQSRADHAFPDFQHVGAASRYRSTNGITRSSREIDHVQQFGEHRAGGVRRAARRDGLCSATSSAWKKVRVHLPGRRRIDSSPAQGRDVRISAVVELSVTGRKQSPSQRCSMCIVERKTVFDLRRMDVELPAMPKHVDEDLRRFGNGRRGVETMPMPDQREIGQRAALANGRGR